MDIFQRSESEVRYYCRRFPAVFDKASGSYIFDEKGKGYLDFFSGAGALNYGHNNPYLINALTEYLASGGILHALDMSTRAKREFLTSFKEKILDKRSLPYKVMFCAPTGTNAVEAALKLAKKATGRQGIVAFSGSFHGMTAGSMAVTSGRAVRKDNVGNLSDVTFMPYPYGFNENFDTIEYMKRVFSDDHSGVDIPAAIIMETVQAEGGVIVAPTEWLKRLKKLCEEFGILLVCDDIQVGCYRTGSYFSFERAGIVPDMVALSKSLSGVGLPMSLLLLKEELDVWEPGEHNGTFRGNQLAFVAAKAAIDLAEKSDMEQTVENKSQIIKKYLTEEIASRDIAVRGIGMIYGIEFTEKGFAEKVSEECFKGKLIVECAGRDRSVLKLMPPLTSTPDELRTGLEIIRNSVKKLQNKYGR